MTTNERQVLLQKHRDLVIATIDYYISRYRSVESNESHEPIEYLERLKPEVEMLYQNSKLSRLKQWLHDLTAEARETGDIELTIYLKEKTGYVFDVSARLQKTIERVIERGKIKSGNEYRDVLTKVDQLIQAKLVDQEKINKLNDLLSDFKAKSDLSGNNKTS